MEKFKHFYEFVHETRLQKEITLREFCRATNLDPSNWSKIERGLADPPKNKETINRIATTLKLNKEEKEDLMCLAMLDSIPEELRPTDDILAKLPIFIRTIKDNKPTEKDLKKLFEKLRKS